MQLVTVTVFFVTVCHCCNLLLWTVCATLIFDASLNKRNAPLGPWNQFHVAAVCRCTCINCSNMEMRRQLLSHHHWQFHHCRHNGGYDQHPHPSPLPRSRLFWYRSQLSGTRRLVGGVVRGLLLQSPVAVLRIRDQDFWHIRQHRSLFNSDSWSAHQDRNCISVERSNNVENLRHA